MKAEIKQQLHDEENQEWKRTYVFFFGSSAAQAAIWRWLWTKARRCEADSDIVVVVMVCVISICTRLWVGCVAVVMSGVNGDNRWNEQWNESFVKGVRTNE